MSVTIGPLFEPVQIAAAATVYATAIGPTRVDAMSCTNTDTVGHTVTIYWVPSSGAAGTANAIAYLRRLQPSESWIVSQFINQVLASGDQVAAICDTAAKVNFFASGTVLTS